MLSLYLYKLTDWRAGHLRASERKEASEMSLQSDKFKYVMLRQFAVKTSIVESSILWHPRSESFLRKPPHLLKKPLVFYVAWRVLYLWEMFSTVTGVTSFWNWNKSTVCQLLPSNANRFHRCETWAHRESILMSVPSPAFSLEKIFRMSVLGSRSKTGSPDTNVSILSKGLEHPILSDFRNLKHAILQLRSPKNEFNICCPWGFSWKRNCFYRNKRPSSVKKIGLVKKCESFLSLARAIFSIWWGNKLPNRKKQQRIFDLCWWRRWRSSWRLWRRCWARQGGKT